MRYFLVIPLLMLLSQKSLKCQQLFTGYILNMTDSSTVEGSHIMNISNNEMAISTKNGGFTIKANKYDTLIFSHVNYQQRQFIILKFNPIAVILNPLHIQLQEVEVNNLPKSPAAFRKRLIDMGNQEAEHFLPFGLEPVKAKADIPPLFQEEKLFSFGPNVSPNSTKIALLSIPIYYFPKKFSKHYKSEMKYFKLKAEKYSTIVSEKKFNRLIVKQLTKLEGDSLEEFMAFLDMDPSFVLRASAYEIAIYIKNKQLEFNDLQNKEALESLSEIKE